MDRILLLFLCVTLTVSCKVKPEKKEEGSVRYRQLNKRFALGDLPSHSSLSSTVRFGRCFAKDSEADDQELRINMITKIRNLESQDYSERYHIILVPMSAKGSQKAQIFDNTSFPEVSSRRLKILTTAYEDNIVRFDIVEQGDELLVKLFELNSQQEIKESFLCEFSEI